MARRNHVFNPHANRNRNANRRNHTNRQGQATRQQGNTANNQPLRLPEKPVPYTFVPVVTQGDQARPVFDAVFHRGTPGLLSGELRCTLTSLTPLFVGHFQYPVKDRTDVTSRGNDEVQLDPDWGLGNNRRVKKDKTFREPLFYGGDTPENARVLIPGASLKGMLRHNIGALLGAPMERVQEQYFSYRPNLAWATNPTRYQCRMAIVREADLTKNHLVVDVLEDEAPRAGFDTNRRRNPDKHPYVGGIDGESILSAGECHTRAWINDDDIEWEVTVSKAVVSHYRVTQKELADPEHGHLARRADLNDSDRRDAKKAILNNMELSPGQLIYVEYDPQTRSITSLGHHFRYRWRYRDSVLVKNRLIPSKQTTRPELTAPENERMSDSGGRLTGARLLFGYVDGAGEGSARGDGSRDLHIVEDKESDAARLAGRIAINAAVEQVENNEKLDARFVIRPGAQDVNGHHRYTLPLKILGQPKASAVEHYLQQPDKHLKTYGDLPGVEGDDTAGDLNGRKFYRHQKGAANDSNLYCDTSNIATNQSGFVQFISQPDRRFRFTLRFKDLHDWELGAILLALNPDYKKPENGEAPFYANKLGHGRPLGLGSVAIAVDSLHLVNDDGELKEDEKRIRIDDCLNAFDETVTACGLQTNLDTWLQVLNFAESVDCEYPNASRDPIYTYHTNIRADYSKKRRSGRAMAENFGEPVKPDYRGRN